MEWFILTMVAIYLAGQSDLIGWGWMLLICIIGTPITALFVLGVLSLLNRMK